MQIELQYARLRTPGKLQRFNEISDSMVSQILWKPTKKEKKNPDKQTNKQTEMDVSSFSNAAWDSVGRASGIQALKNFVQV